MLIYHVLLSLMCGVLSEVGARLLFPPQRNLLLQQGHNSNDAALNYGGIKQWLLDGGQCNTCVDTRDKLNTIKNLDQFLDIFIKDDVAKHKVIKLIAELPSNGCGDIEVRSCKSKVNQLPQDCLDENAHYIEDANSIRYKVGEETRVGLTILLPETIMCEKCVLQWKHVKGEKKCHKCQETVYNCANIALQEIKQMKSKHRVKRQLNQPTDPNLLRRIVGPLPTDLIPILTITAEKPRPTIWKKFFTITSSPI